MAEFLRAKSRREAKGADGLGVVKKEEPKSEIESYSTEVLNALIKDGLPPTPSNFSLYFDRLLEDKSQNAKDAILAILELEECNEDERMLLLEQNLKKGFSSIKNILALTTSFYKNTSVMSKILKKRQEELGDSKSDEQTSKIINSLASDVDKLNSIVSSQNTSMKELYDNTVKIIKSAEGETIFDNQYGVYNKRFILNRIEHEIDSVKRYKHKSSLIMIELSKDLRSSVPSDKAIGLMTRTISRLLLKTSRRSDVVAHYGNGVFIMLLKYTDIESAKKAAERLSDLISNSTFFLGEKEIQLSVAMGITDITEDTLAEEIIVSSMDGVERSYEETDAHYSVALRG